MSYNQFEAINELFDKRIEHQGINKFGEYLKIRTAIREESIKLAKYLRGERKAWVPRIAV